jgi:hypothetical protein
MRNTKQHEDRYIHVPKRWLRLLIFIPALLLANIVWDFFSFGTFSLTINGWTTGFSGGTAEMWVIGAALAADIMSLSLAWYKKRLVAVAVAAVVVAAVAVAVAAVVVAAVAVAAAVVAVVVAVAVAAVVAVAVAAVAFDDDIEEEDAWWYFDD